MVGAITDDALVIWLHPIMVMGAGKNAVFFGQIDNLHFRSLVGLFVLENTFHCYLPINLFGTKNNNTQRDMQQ